MARPLPASVLAATGGEPDAVRTHILDAAHRVIVRDGLGAASTRAISDESGLAAGTLYNYFADRLDLVAAAIVHRGQRAAAPITALVAGTGTVQENLAAFAAAARTVLDELLPLTAAAFADPPLLRELRRRVAGADVLGDPSAVLIRYLREEQRLGRVRDGADCEAAASVVVSMCHDDAFRRHLLGAPTPSRERELALIAAAIGVDTPEESS